MLPAMKFRISTSILIAITLLVACSSAPKPKMLNGKHRQPINTDIPLANTAIERPSDQQTSSFAAPDTASCLPENIATSALPSPEQVHIEEPAHVFRFQFPYRGIALAHSDQPEWIELIERAKYAQRILIRGRTDGATHSKGDEDVALHRAINTRNALVTYGINPARIWIDYLSGGDYLADNTTPEGRRQNRRVEIELREINPTSVTSIR